LKLVLEVDAASAPATASGSTAPSSPGSTPTPRDGGAPGEAPDVEPIDPAEFADDGPNAETDQESEAQARLLEAFPGASEVLG
jgi:hypothetical protein